MSLISKEEQGGIKLHEHYNLYYIFLEDKLENRMPEDKRQAIRKKLLKKLKKIKPNENLKPPKIKNKK